MVNPKLIERVKRLYAMSMDQSSPNEAAIAARRARSLMDEHGITLENLQTSEFSSECAGRAYKRPPRWYGWLALGVAEYNDCVIRYMQTDDGEDTFSPEFRGYAVDVQSCALMLDYLVSTMERECRRFMKNNNGQTGRSAANSFRIGYADTVRERLRELTEKRESDHQQLAVSSGTGTSLVLAKKDAVTEEFGEQKFGKRTRVAIRSANAFEAGREAGERTSLNNQVSGSTMDNKRITA